MKINNTYTTCFLEKQLGHSYRPITLDCNRKIVINLGYIKLLIN